MIMEIYTITEKETNSFSNPMPILIGIFFDYTRALEWLDEYITKKETYEGFERRDTTNLDNQVIFNNGIVLRYIINSVWFDDVGSPWKIITKEIDNTKKIEFSETVSPREDISVEPSTVEGNSSQIDFPVYRNRKKEYRP